MVSERPIPRPPCGLAVDFGGTKIAAARIVNSRIAKHIQIETDGNAEIDTYIETVAALLDRLDIRDDDRIGVAVSGRVTASGEWHALNLRTLSQVRQVPLRQILSTRFQRDVTVENDATAAAFGEYLTGASSDLSSIGFITVSTGVGGGFVLDGVPMRSRSGLAGHVGFTTSRIPGGLCGSGRSQTIESIASGKAIARQASDSGHEAHDAKAVFQAHLNGDIWATTIVKRSAMAIAELCTNLKATLDPDVIYLGGSIGLAEGYLSLVQHFADKEPEVFRPMLAQATLGKHGALIGILAI